MGPSTRALIEGNSMRHMRPDEGFQSLAAVEFGGENGKTAGKPARQTSAIDRFVHSE